MSEYYYTKSLVTKSIGGVDVEPVTVKVKLSLDGIKMIYNTNDSDGNECVMIEYKDGSDMTIYDSFESIDKAHDSYLLSIKNNHLIQMQ